MRVSFYCLDLGLFIDTLIDNQQRFIARLNQSEDTTPRVTHLHTNNELNCLNYKDLGLNLSLIAMQIFLGLIEKRIACMQMLNKPLVCVIFFHYFIKLITNSIVLIQYECK